MANKNYIIMLNNKDSIYGTIQSSSAKKICNDYVSGCKERKVYQDTEGYFTVDFKNVTAILVTEIEKPKKIGF